MTTEPAGLTPSQTAGPYFSIGLIGTGIDPWLVDPGDPRIVALAGDLAEPALGLDAEAWAGLRDEIDTIVHCGALVHHLSPYLRLRPANVEGTRTLLRLAAEGRGKRLHHVSTLSVFAAAGPRRRVT